ncbi:MAG: alcohol dehydrogenase catalytic domain-containing protein [Blastocatellia bacterium]
MKAFQFVEFRKPGEIREVPVPEPGPGQVLVKIGGAGACHSDLHILEMEKPPEMGSVKIPFTLGHENAGWVEKLGPGTTGCAPGDPVIVYGPWGCGLCANCRMGMENYCEKPGGPTPGGLGNYDGGMAHYLLVPSGRFLVPLGSLSKLTVPRSLTNPYNPAVPAWIGKHLKSVRIEQEGIGDRD